MSCLSTKDSEYGICYEGVGRVPPVSEVGCSYVTVNAIHTANECNARTQ